MSDNHSNDPEYQDLQNTLACAREITRTFDNMTVRLRLDKLDLATLSGELGRLGNRGPANPGSIVVPAPYQGAFQEIDQSLARRKALGKELVNAAATFAQELIRWAEALEKRKQQQQAPALLLAPSVPLVTSGNTRMLPDELGDVTSKMNPNKSCVHDNSGGKPGVLIYTSDWATYVRYTTSESKFGQLENAYVTYFGDSDEFATILLDAEAGDNFSAEFNGVSFIHRVFISPQESWYFLDAHDAQIKQEAMAFNAISAATIPRLTGFSATAGASEEAATGAVKTADADISSAVEVGIPWGKGIRIQGMT